MVICSEEARIGPVASEGASIGSTLSEGAVIRPDNSEGATLLAVQLHYCTNISLNQMYTSAVFVISVVGLFWLIGMYSSNPLVRVAFHSDNHLYNNTLQGHMDILAKLAYGIGTSWSIRFCILPCSYWFQREYTTITNRVAATRFLVMLVSVFLHKALPASVSKWLCDPSIMPHCILQSSRGSVGVGQIPSYSGGSWKHLLRSESPRILRTSALAQLSLSRISSPCLLV